MSNLFGKVTRLMEILVDFSTGDSVTIEMDKEYKILRAHLLRNPRTRKKMPDFIPPSRELMEFWYFIRDRYGTYAERRAFLAEAFADLLNELEFEQHTPGEATALAVLSEVSPDNVQEFWQKALERKDIDPSGAITMARTLMESVCKFVLDEKQVEYDETEDLPKLYKMVAKELNLAPSQHTEMIFKQILGSCQAIVGGLSAIRNRLSDAHAVAVKPSERHAKFAVNLAGTMATFIIETFEYGKRKK